MSTNSRPQLRHDATGGPYVENDPPLIICDTISITDRDSTTLVGAVVQIERGFEAGLDMLGFTNQNGITGSYDGTTGTLTLSGTASLADYEAALGSVTYWYSGEDPQSKNRKFTFQVDDGASSGNLSSAMPVKIGFVVVNDLPVLTVDPLLAYSVFQAPATLSPALTLADPDSDMRGAVVTISGNYHAGEDVLSWTAVAGIKGSFDAGTGVLTFSGKASVAAYEQVLRSVTYTDTHASPTLLDRTITIQVRDQDHSGPTDLSNVGTITVVYAAPPNVTVSGTPITYTEGDPAVTLASTLALTDLDDPNMAGATVSITAGFDTGDSLLFTNTASITGSYNSSTGVLTLTGSDTVANYQAALRSIQFVGTSDNPSTSKTITWVVNDGSYNSAAKTTTIAITPVNDAPTLSISATLAYTENDAATAIATGATLSDPDSPDFNGGSLTVSFTANGTSADQLTIVNQGTGAGQIGVSGSSITYGGTTIGTFTGGTNGTDLVISFTSTAATQAAVQALTRDIAFSNTSESPSTSARTVQFTVVDGDGGTDSSTASATVNVTSVNDAPVVTMGGTPASYTENGSAIALDGSLTVTDADNANLSGATVSITGNFQTGDALVFTDQNGITGSYNSGTGVLSLSGSATVAQYQTALRSITFQSSSDDPTTSKTVSWVVNDGTDSSNTHTSTINITPVNDAPTLSISATLAYTENDAATAIATGATLSDPDSPDFNGGSLTVSFTANGTSADQLTIINQGTGAGQIGVSGSSITYGGTTIGTFTGGINGTDLVISFTSTAATQAAVQALARDIAFSNTSESPSTSARTVQFTVVDGDGGTDSSTASATVNVTSVNDIPVVTTSAGDASFTEGGAAVTIDASIALSDLDNTTFASATVSIGTGFLTGHDVLAFTNSAGMGNIAGSYDSGTGVLTLTSSGASATVAEWQTALASVTFDTDSNSPGVARPISFVVNDGTDASLAGTKTIAITEVNSAPTVTTTAGSAAFVEAGGAIVIDSALAVADLDTATLVGATIHISTGFQSGQDVLAFTPVGSITGSYNSATGTLTLSGSGTLAEYQTALESVTYDNTSGAPDTTTRTIEFQVDDGQSVDNLSTVATRTVTVAAVNSPPSLTLGAALSYTENDAASSIVPAATVSDQDSADFNGGSLTVSFTANGTAADQLAIQNIGTSAGQIGVSGSNVTYGGLTIGTFTGGTNGADLVISFTTADATAAATQALVRAITFANTSEDPSSAARTVHFALVDGDGGSDTGTADATVNVTSVNDAPVLANGAGTALAYTENDAATAINGAITISDVDSTNLTGATVTISSNYANGEDVLAFTPVGGITGSFDSSTGVLTLSGSDTLANYQTALQGVTYANTSDNPSTATRTVTFEVNDGSATHNLSNDVARDITVTAVNDAPSITAGGTLAYTENDAATAIKSTLTVTDAEGDTLTGAHVTISANFQSGQDVLSFTPTGSITGSFDSGTGVLTLSGTDTAANYQTALRSVTYVNTSDNPSTATRTISFDATDSHSATSTAATTTVTVAAVNDAPVNTVPADSAVGTAFSNTAMSISGVSIADVDAGSATMTVHVTVTNGGATFSLAGGASVSAGTNGTGDVTLSGTSTQLNAALSTLSYKSNDGFTGSDTVTVVTSDGGNTGSGGTKTDTDTFHVGVVPQVFIIDNTDATSDASSNAGTAANPYNSIASFNTNAVDGAGDYVYIMHGTGTYSEASGLTLNNNEQVYGQGQTLQFTNPVTGAVVTVGTGSAGNTPTISITGASQAGVTLAQGNTLKGFDIATTLGSQTGVTDGGGTVGTLNVNDVSVTGTGMAVDIDQGGTLNTVFDTLSSSGSSQQGVQLAGTLSGSFTATTGAISGSTGTGFLVGDGAGTANTGGTFTLSYGGTVSTTGTAKAVDIEDRSVGAGTVNFSGAISHSSGNANGIYIADIAGGPITFSGNNTLNTGTSNAIQATNVTSGTLTFSGNQDIDTTTGTGISLSSNSVTTNFTGSGITVNTTSGTGVSVSSNSGTVSFNNSGAGLDVVTTAGGTGVSAASSGTLTIQGTSNTVSSTSGTAINVASTTIGGSGLNFVSVSSSGAASGIVLNNTGSTGSLNVTGSGSANTGGTISGSTGDAISVNSGSINLNYVQVSSPTGNGINATNLLGSNSFNNGTITGFDSGATFTKDGITWVNTGTSAGSLTVSNSTFSNGAGGNDGLFMEAQGSGAMTLTVSGSTFTGLFGDGIQVNGTTSSTSTERVTIQNSIFTNAVASTGNGGISLNPYGNVTFYADVNNNTFDSIMNPVTTLGAIGVTNGLNANADITIRNNQIDHIAGARGITITADGGTTDLLIDNNTVDDLGSTSKSAINVGFTATASGAATGNVTVSNNQVGVNGTTAGILWTSGDGTANGILLQSLNGSSMTAAVTGNTVDANTTSVIEVVRLRAAATTGFTGGTINGTVTNNTIADTQPSTHVEFDATAGTSTLGGTVNLNITGNTLPGSGVGVIKLTENASGTLNVTQSSSSAVSTANSSATVTVTGTPTYGSAAPPTPSTPSLPLLASGAGDGSHAAHSITTAELADVVAAAANRWAEMPLTDAQLHTLSNLTFAVGQLDGSAIGTQVPGLIVFDADAGGLGWYVDATPMDDAEFASNGSASHLVATDAAAASQVDLLTAVMHEMGHALGLSDLYGTTNQDDLMYGYIEVGERRLPTAADTSIDAPVAIVGSAEGTAEHLAVA